MAMLERIVVDVIHVACKVGIVADEVFPIAALPNPAFAFEHPAPPDVFTARHAPGEVCLYEHPLRGVVIIAQRQRPERM